MTPLEGVRRLDAPVYRRRWMTRLQSLRDIDAEILKTGARVLWYLDYGPIQLLARRGPTMLELPSWIVELPVVMGFILLALQATVDLVRLPYVEAPAFRVEKFHK